MTVQRILVRSPNWVGDHVMAVPFYQGLRDYYPQAHLALLHADSLSSLPLPPLFDAVYPFARRSKKERQGLTSHLGRERFDLAISLPASYSSSVLFWKMRIPHRVGFFRGGSDLFLTAGLKWKPRGTSKHRSEIYLELLRFLSATGFSPSLPVSPKIRERKKTILIAPGSAMGLRVWPYFSELVDGLVREFPDHRLVVVGTTQEKDWWRSAHSKPTRVEDRVGETSLAEVLSLAQEASLVVANDSGIAHVAASLGGSPTLVLFGPGDPRHVRPLGEKVRVERVTDLPCSPCESSTCSAPYGYQRCLKDLGWESVLKTAREMLRE